MKKSNIIFWIKSPIGILLIAGFILRVILFFLFQPYNHLNEVIVSDAEGYHRLAMQLLNSGNFIVQNTNLDTFRTPAYPAFISKIYLVFGVNPPLVLFIQIFVNLASVYILYLIGENIFNKKIGFISALLLSLDLDHLYNIYSLLTDTLFVFILLLACLYLIYFFKRNKLFYLILTSLLIGVATLVRPIAMLFPFVIIFIVFIYTIRNKSHNPLTILKYVALIIIA
jgi:4-amino-4-deoxy-L-arabinose transferase-like glycosyltransferase